MEKNTVPFNGGLELDNGSDSHGKEQTWDYALNLVLGSWEGDMITVTNEPGNNAIFNFPDGTYCLIGSAIMPDNNIVTFLTNNTISIIGIHTVDTDQFDIVIKTECLNFKCHNQISAKTRIISGCERKVYFTDWVNPYYGINLDNLDQYLTKDLQGNPLYGDVDGANNNPADGWDCTKFEHFLSGLPVCIDTIEVRDGGGSIPAGAHQFAIRYLDENLNGSPWAPLTYPIFVYTESITDGDGIDGEETGTDTAKNIKFTLSNLDIDFTYVQFAVASSINGTGNISETFILDNVPIQNDGAGGGTAEYVYFGFDPTSHTISTIDDITIPSLPFLGVIAHEIHDNRLFLANAGINSENWAITQRAALLSEVKWRMYKDYEKDEGRNFTSIFEDTATKNAEVIFDGKTLMRDEIYSLGVVFVLSDGSESPVFHIPGRPKDLEYSTNTNLTTIANANSRNSHISRGSVPYTGGWDSQLLQVTPEDQLSNPNTQVGYNNVVHLLDRSNCPSPSPSPSITLGYNVIDLGGGNARLTINFPNASDTALVKININGMGRFDQHPDSRIINMSGASNTLDFTFNNVISSTFSMQIWYTNGVTGNSYHELTGGVLLSRIIGPGFRDIHLNQSDFEFDPNCNIDLERWQVHNTFVITGANTDTTIEGYMGYYEVDNAPYPNIYDCAGTHIYDATSLGGPDLSQEFIRHHRMPDCGADAESWGLDACDLGLTKRTVNADDEKTIELNKLGLIVDLTNVYNAIATSDPELRDKIIGHYIVYGNRDEIDKTIVDKGYMWRAHNKSNIYYDFLGQPGAGPNQGWWNAWFNNAEDATGSNTYDDLPIVSFPIPFPGRTDRNDYVMTDAFHSEWGFTSGWASYLNYGYNNGFENFAIGSPTNGGLHASSLNINEYLSPSTRFDRKIKVGNYVKIETMINSWANPDNPDLEVVSSFPHDTGPDLTLPALDARTRYECMVHSDFWHIAPSISLGNVPTGDATGLRPVDQYKLGFQRKLTGSAGVPWNAIGSAGSFSKPIQLSNEAYGQPTAFYETAAPFPLPMSMAPTRLSGLIRGINLNTADANNEIQNNFGGRVLPNHYVSIKNNKDVFVSLQNIIYNRLNTCFIADTADSSNELIKGGDTFLTRVRDVKTWYRKAGLNDQGDNFIYGNVKTFAWSIEGIVESDKFNTSLAYSSVPNSNYALKNFNRYTHLNIGSAGLPSHNLDNLWEGIDLQTEADMNDNKFGYREFEYQINPDFSKNHTNNQTFPLSDTYNYCNDCGNREPNNVYYSNKGFASDRTDAMRIIPANNSFPIPSNFGEVTNLFLQKDKLFAHTPKALLSVQTRPQKLNTDAATIEVGVGEIGEIPPEALVSVDYGYAGSEDPFGTISTHYGTFFVDASAGKIFLFAPGKGLKEVSKVKGEQWFKDHLPVKFRKDFQILFDAEYPVRATSSNNAVGFQSVFDPRLERIVLHKKDYEIHPDWVIDSTLYGNATPLPLVGTGNNTVYAFLTDDDYVEWYYSDIVGGAITLTNLNDINRFVNLGWTLSFDLKSNKWISFHSYQPSFMYNSNTNFFSFINNNTGTVWKHDNYNYQKFYGIKYDHIIDLNVGVSFQQNIFNSVQYVSEVYLYNPVTDTSLLIENSTFDKFYAYTNSQITQLRDLIIKQPNLYQEVTLPLNQTLVDRTDNYWRFSRFRDEVGDRTQTITTSQWTDILNNYDSFGQGHIDQVVNPLAIDINKSLYELSRLRDRSLNIRLFYNPIEDYKIVTQILSFSTTKSLR